MLPQHVPVVTASPFPPLDMKHCHENLKRCLYEQWVRVVKHASLTPPQSSLSLVVWAQLQPPCTYKQLGSLLSFKWDQPYSHVMAWLRCRLSFSLLQSSIMCIRGSRSSCGHTASCPLAALMWYQGKHSCLVNCLNGNSHFWTVEYSVLLFLYLLSFERFFFS